MATHPDIAPAAGCPRADAQSTVLPQEVTVNVGDLGRDLEHCLQLHRRLREFRGVWAGVRALCQEKSAKCIPTGNYSSEQ